MSVKGRKTARFGAAALVAAVILLSYVETAHARVYGVLAAASRTEAADRPVLEGVANDLLAMREALLARGAEDEDIVRLLDAGGNGAKAASRKEILQALAEAAEKAMTGDQVVVYLSGHGGQTADNKALSEADGLDELFLAFGPQAISDDEIGEALDRIRAKGADVLFIGDFCHAGDSVRGEAVRVAPANFALSAEIEGSAVRGRLTAIFASPANRAAMQSVGPVWASPEERRVQSVLTMYVSAALRDTNVATYRDLKNSIVVGVAAHADAFPWMRRNLASPQFEGDLDAKVLLPGRSAAMSGPWPVRFEAGMTELALGHGALDGLASGDVLSFWQEGAGDAEPKLVFHGRVAVAGPAHAQVVPEPVNGAASGSWTNLTDRYGAALDYTTVLTARRTTVSRAFDPREVLRAAARGQPDPKSANIAKALSLDIAAWRPEGGCEADLTLAADGALPAGTAGWIGTAEYLEVRGCDVMFARLTNGSQHSVDVTFLVMEPSGQIEPLSTAPSVLGGRLPPGASLTGAYAFAAATEAFSAELAVVAAAAGGEADQIVSYSHLCAPAQDGTNTCMGAQRALVRGGASEAGAGILGSVVLMRNVRVTAGGGKGSVPE